MSLRGHNAWRGALESVREPAALAVDLDGTLLNGKRHLSRGTLFALEAALAAGIPVLPVTARRPADVWPRFQVPGLGPLGACSNGAILIDMATGRLLSHHSITKGEACRLISAARDADCGASFASETVNGLIGQKAALRRLHVRFEGPTGAHGMTVEDLEDAMPGEVTKLLVFPSKGREGYVQKVVEKAGFNAIHVGTWIEAQHPLARKDHSLLDLLGRIGISPTRCVAVGDGANDEEMLACVAMGFRMDESARALVEAGHPALPGNDEDGVAALINEVVAQAAVV